MPSSYLNGETISQLAPQLKAEQVRHLHPHSLLLIRSQSVTNKDIASVSLAPDLIPLLYSFITYTTQLLNDKQTHEFYYSHLLPSLFDLCISELMFLSTDASPSYSDSPTRLLVFTIHLFHQPTTLNRQNSILCNYMAG